MSQTVIVEPIDAAIETAKLELRKLFGKKKKAKDWGILDSLNYAVANVLHCLFVTGDPHFKDSRKDVIFLR